MATACRFSQMWLSNLKSYRRVAPQFQTSVNWIFIVSSCSLEWTAAEMSRRRQGSRASRPHRESHFAVDVPMIRLNPDASLRPSSPPPLPHGFTYGAEGIFAPICQDFPARSPPPQNARRSGPATRQAPATAPSAKISIGIISLVHVHEFNGCWNCSSVQFPCRPSIGKPTV